MFTNYEYSKRTERKDWVLQWYSYKIGLFQTFRKTFPSVKSIVFSYFSPSFYNKLSEYLNHCNKNHKTIENLIVFLLLFTSFVFYSISYSVKRTSFHFISCLHRCLYTFVIYVYHISSAQKRNYRERIRKKEPHNGRYIIHTQYISSRVVSSLSSFTIEKFYCVWCDATYTLIFGV